MFNLKNCLVSKAVYSLMNFNETNRRKAPNPGGESVFAMFGSYRGTERARELACLMQQLLQGKQVVWPGRPHVEKELSGFAMIRDLILAPYSKGDLSDHK